MRSPLPLLALIPALLLTQCLRGQPEPGNDVVDMRYEPLSVPASFDASPEDSDIALVDAWSLHSENTGFGSLSGLIQLSNGRMLAYSDRGMRLSFAPPPGDLSPVFESIVSESVLKKLRDVEAVAIDLQGREWIVFEGGNRLAYRSLSGTEWQMIKTPATSDWPSNGGVETMTVLQDGRLLLVEESTSTIGGKSRALLYTPGSPLGAPTEFTFVPPPGYRPTDAATLPDGRVLILLRAVRFMPPGFMAKIVLADPAEIAAGKPWRGEEIARLSAPAPIDNMEGIAVSDRGDGSFDLWLISDDNGVTLQRTLLLKLIYRPRPAAEP